MTQRRDGSCSLVVTRGYSWDKDKMWMFLQLVFPFHEPVNNNHGQTPLRDGQGWGSGVRGAGSTPLATSLKKNRKEMVLLLVWVQLCPSLMMWMVWNSDPAMLTWLWASPPWQLRWNQDSQDLPVPSAAGSVFSISCPNKCRKRELLPKAVDQVVVGVDLHPSGRVPLAQRSWCSWLM